MTVPCFNASHRLLLQELSDADKNLVAVRTQREQHDIILKEIHELLKEIKTNRNIECSKIYGGNIVVSKNKDDIIKSLTARKMELENALAGIREQEQMRADYYSEVFFKTLTLLCGLCAVNDIEVLKNTVKPIMEKSA